MARVSHTPQAGSENQRPTNIYLEWKSNDRCFSYWDNEAKENVALELPQKFLFLQHYHTVKGWDNGSESKIYSNEVYFIGKEEMNVRSYKGGGIVKGIYKEIKDKLNGGRYHRSIYVMLEDGTIANISLKGAA